MLGQNPVVMAACQTSDNIEQKHLPEIKRVRACQLLEGDKHQIEIEWSKRVNGIKVKMYCRGCWNFAYQYL
jgi:desulfoferrodoxin (superoxide reductase-like protein)